MDTNSLAPVFVPDLCVETPPSQDGGEVETGEELGTWCAHLSTPKALDAELTLEADECPRPNYLHKLRTLWFRMRYSSSWLVFYALLNCVGIAVRFLSYPKDSAAWFWPGIAKGSAESILINVVLTLLFVCYHFVRKLHSWIGNAPPLAFAVVHPAVEKHIAFHKIAGTMALIASLVHSLAWMCIIATVRTCSEHDWQRSAYHHHQFLRERTLSEVLAKLPMWTGVLMLLCVLVAIPFCLPCARNRSYRTFLLVHTVFAPFVGLLLIHGAACWMGELQAPYWLSIPLTVYLWEHRQRRKTSYAETRVVRVELQTDTIILTLTKSRRFQQHLRPGMALHVSQFVFVQVPTISRVEWHPFSISSAPQDDHIEVHIQQVGDWTCALSTQLQQHKQLKIRVNGPMGTSTEHFRRYEVVAFLATGIGVTPFLSVIRHTLFTWRQEQRHRAAGTQDRSGSSQCPKKVYFVWSTRDTQRLEWVLDIIGEFQDVFSDPKYKHAIEFHVHLTSSPTAADVNATTTTTTRPLNLRRQESPHALPNCVDLHCARPNWSDFLAYLGAQSGYSSAIHHHEKPLGVFVCMNRGLTKHVKDEIAAHNAMRAAGRIRGPRLDAFAETF